MAEPTPVTESYIATIEEAAAYFAGDPRASAFLALNAGMAWYLQRATKIIDNLPLKGTTYWEFTADAEPGPEEQNRQFPRYIDGMAYGWDNDTSLPEVPQEVLDACCEEALALYLFYADSDGGDRKRMRDEGVQSFSMGGQISESLGKSHLEKHGLISTEARQLLKGYLVGAVEVTF